MSSVGLKKDLYVISFFRDPVSQFPPTPRAVAASELYPFLPAPSPSPALDVDVVRLGNASPRPVRP